MSSQGFVIMDKKRVKKSAVQPLPPESKSMFPDETSSLGSKTTSTSSYSTYSQFHLPYIQSPTKRAVKNVLTLGLAFMLVYTAFNSIQSLQSTMNADSGVGLASLSCVYGATVLSCFLAPWLIYKLSTRWTILLGFALFIVYLIVHFEPLDLLILPSSCLLGLLMGPLWIAQATYLTTTAYTFSNEKCQIFEKVVAKFNGMFCCVYQLSHIWGNTLTALVLNNDQTIELNNKSQQEPHPCGAQDCGLYNHPNYTVNEIAHIPNQTQYLLLSIYLACVVVAIVLVLTVLDDAQVPFNLQTPSSHDTRTMVLGTVNMFRDWRFYLLIPLVLFTGLEQGFLLGDFTKSYVNCALGIHAIGQVLVTFGAVTAASALTLAHLTKHIKRFFIVLSGCLFHAGLLIVLAVWKPAADDVPMFYVISACLGLCDAIWQTQSMTLFGVLFPDKQEAAFAAYRVFQSLGYSLAFGYSYYLCVETKLYILAGTLFTALSLYSWIEHKLYLREKRCEMAQPIAL